MSAAKPRRRLHSSHVAVTPCTPLSSEHAHTPQRRSPTSHAPLPVCIRPAAEKQSLRECISELRNTLLDVALQHGVSENAATLSFHQAPEFTFEDGRGWKEARQALLECGGKERFATEQWSQHHYGMIVWKLACYQRSCPQTLAGHLRWSRVLHQLKRRYELEVNRSRHSFIKLILQRDLPAVLPVVLCVAALVPEDEEGDVLLTDGWYCIKAVLDNALKHTLRRGKLFVGQKLRIYGARLSGPDACTVLEPRAMRTLFHIHVNGTRRAPWHATLGRLPHTFGVRLAHLHEGGGNAPRVRFLVERVLPCLYHIRVPGSDHKAFANEKAQRAQRQRIQRQRSSAVEEVRQRVQKENPDMCADELVQEIEDNVADLRHGGDCTAVLKLVVRELDVDANVTSTTACLTIWRPSSDALDFFREGRACEATAVGVATRSGGQDFHTSSDVQLSLNSGSAWTRLQWSGMGSYVRPQAPFPIAALRSLTRGQLFDAVGVVVHNCDVRTSQRYGRPCTSQTVFVSSPGQSDLLAVDFQQSQFVQHLPADGISLPAVVTVHDLVYTGIDARFGVHNACSTDFTRVSKISHLTDYARQSTAHAAKITAKERMFRLLKSWLGKESSLYAVKSHQERIQRILCGLQPVYSGSGLQRCEAHDASSDKPTHAQSQCVQGVLRHEHFTKGVRVQLSSSEGQCTSFGDVLRRVTDCSWSVVLDDQCAHWPLQLGLEGVRNLLHLVHEVDSGAFDWLRPMVEDGVVPGVLADQEECELHKCITSGHVQWHQEDCLPRVLLALLHCIVVQPEPPSLPYHLPLSQQHAQCVWEAVTECMQHLTLRVTLCPYASPLPHCFRAVEMRPVPDAMQYAASGRETGVQLMDVFRHTTRVS